MKISIVTPTFNSESHIKNNILSVIKQDYKNFEHIIVDNISTDNTINISESVYKELGSSKNLKIICEKDKGIADAFNKGIAAASGEVILILNSDDELMYSGIFSDVTSVLKEEIYLFTHCKNYFEDPDFGSNIRQPLLCPIREAMPYNHPGMFVKKSVYDEYGVFRTDYKFAMDYELILRLETSIGNFRETGFYFKDRPMVKMKAGGASWKYELKGIEEIKKALEEYGMYDESAKRSFNARIRRTKIKSVLGKIGLKKAIKIWRYFKWK